MTRYAVWGWLFAGVAAVAATQGCSNETGELSSTLGGGVSFVQAAAATPQGTVSSVDVPLSTPQQTGDLNLVAVGWMDVTAPSVVVTDALGNAYVQAGTTTQGRGMSQAIYLATNIQSGANIVHVSFSSGVTDPDVRVLEYDGLESNQALVAMKGATGRGRTASSGTLTTVSPNELVVGLGMTTGAFSEAGSGFTMRIITSPNGNIAEDATAVTAGSYAATARLTSSSRWLMQAVALKPVASSPTPDGGVGGTSITIGETNILASDDGGNANLLLAQKATLAQSATIQSLSFYVTTAAGSLRLGIYDATGAGGNPGAVKAQTNSFTPISGWNTVNVVTPVALPAGTYWLAYLPSSNSLGFRLDRSSGTHAFVSFAFGAMPAAFPAPATLSTGHWSFYATLNTDSVTDTQAPSVPVNPAASAVSSSRIDLTWSASSDNVGVTGYRVYRGGSLIATVSNTNYSNPGLSASTAYSYQVSALDAAGNESAKSATVSATTLPASNPGVGPTGPVGPVATSCSGVNLTPGMSIQTAVNNNATGTVFCLAAGTYAQQHVVPKSGNKFIGAVGTILDGQNAIVRAFDGSASNVTIQNLIIQNYAGGYQTAPVYITGTTGWKVLNNEIRYNAGVGIVFASNVLVQFNKIHHNQEMGFGSDGGVGIVVDSNEIAFNNYQDLFNCDECGGSKLWATEGAQITHNHSHDNHGPGLWDDFNNNNITYAYNLIENNYMQGIHHEIGYNASIHDNVIKNNGRNWMWSNCGWLWCAAIDVAASAGVNGGMIEIYNNTITPGSMGGNAIGLIQQDRTNSEASMGPWDVQNVWVHDNYFDMSLGGNTGGVQDLGDNSIFTSRNNHFDRNTYKLGNNTSPFWWMNNDGGKAFWQGFGMDINGTFIP